MIRSAATGIWMTNRLEQLFAVVVTAGLVLGNFLLFTPWRNGQDPRLNKTDPSELRPHLKP